MNQQYYKFVTAELKDAYSGSVDYTQAIGKWLTLPENEVDRNGNACGRGFHLMKIPNPKYCRYEVGFLAIGKGKLGEDEEKIRFKSIKLIRPLKKLEIFFQKAELSEADLSGANLSEADLSEANLSRANLSRANLSEAYLSGANLSRADLSRANLSEADLSGSDLSGADLFEADLFRAIMPDGKVHD